MANPRASSVSRQIKAGWGDMLPFPTVEQMSDHVLLEGDAASLGEAASVLARNEHGYTLTFGGQWADIGLGHIRWFPWVEVRRP